MSSSETGTVLMFMRVSSNIKRWGERVGRHHHGRDPDRLVVVDLYMSDRCGVCVSSRTTVHLCHLYVGRIKHSHAEQTLFPLPVP